MHPVHLVQLTLGTGTPGQSLGLVGVHNHTMARWRTISWRIVLRSVEGQVEGLGKERELMVTNFWVVPGHTYDF